MPFYSKIQAPVTQEWVLTPDTLGSRRTGSRVPLRSPEEQRVAQLVSLRRGAGKQAVLLEGAGEGCQGKQQAKQGLLKFYPVSELLCSRIKIHKPGGWLWCKVLLTKFALLSCPGSCKWLGLMWEKGLGRAFVWLDQHCGRD